MFKSKVSLVCKIDYQNSKSVMCTFLNSNGLVKEGFQLEIDYFIKKSMNLKCLDTELSHKLNTV